MDTKEQVEAFAKLCEEFEKACDAACKRYAEVWRLKEKDQHFRYICDWYIDCHEFAGRGTECWSYGGEEEHYWSQHLRSLWDETWWADQQEKADDYHRALRRKAELQMKADRNHREELYKELSKEFNG